MKNNQYHLIKLTKLSSDNTVNELIIPLKTDSYKRYFNSLHITLQLDGKELAFFDFLCEKMDEENRVFIDKELKKEFKDLIKRVTSGKVEYNEIKLTNVVLKLRKLQLIFEVNDIGKSYFYVNPKYAFKGLIKERTQLVEAILRKRVEENRKVDMLVNEPLDEHYVPEYVKKGKKKK